MVDPLSPQLKALLSHARDVAVVTPDGWEAQILRELDPLLQKGAAAFPCLGCTHAVIVLNDQGLGVGACKRFVALPRNDDLYPGFALLRMHCSAALEIAAGAGSWDDLDKQYQATAGAGESKREQQRPIRECARG